MSETASRKVRVAKLQKLCWNYSLACLEWHQGRMDPDAEDPRPAYHNYMIQYYNVLRPYLKNTKGVEEYWEKNVEGVPELDSLKGLDEWRYKYKKDTTHRHNPNDGDESETKTSPKFFSPEKVSKIVDVLDEVALELGFSANPDEQLPTDKI